MISNSSSDILRNRFEKLNVNHSRRVLMPRLGIDFSSNDYLGFCQDPDLKSLFLESVGGLALGSSGSRLLRGQAEVFESFENLAADFCGRESALLYSSGYQANLGLLSALLTPADIVFSDQLNHASIIDGIRLSGARKVIYPHCDIKILRDRLEVPSEEACLKVIVTESLFSMDGDLAPLPQLADLAEEFSALLIVDEAHASGLWGDFSQNHGGGLVQALGLTEKVFATNHPAGKAFGAAGAWVCGDSSLKDYLINFSRSFIFSTAPAPFLPALLKGALAYWRQVGKTRARTVFENSRIFREYLANLLPDVAVPQSQGPIIPIIIGDNAKALRLASQLQESGFDVRAIRPPTVPEGGARLRITLNSNHSFSQIESLARSIIKFVNP